MRKSKIKVIDLTMEQVSDLVQSVKNCNLPEDQQKVILVLIEQIVDIKRTSEERKAALNRAKRLLGSSTEKGKKEPSETKLNKKKGHGRNGVDKYKISHTYNHEHELKTGSLCDLCGKGKLGNMTPKTIIRLIGQPAIIAELHRPERLRCSGCGAIFTAKLPEEVGDEKSTASANALVAVYRYGMGLPNYRLAAMQKAVGVPLPASTQYEMSEMLWTKIVPIHKELMRQAANYSIIYTDDTTGKILSLMKDKEKRKAKGERVGIFTTGIVAKRDGHTINLFFTGRKHAGENFADLLDLRNTDLEIPIQVGDAATRNIPKNHMTNLVLCLVHARRNFYDCLDNFDDDATYVIEQIASIYKNEKIITNKAMKPEDRLKYHKTHSEPIMIELLKYAKDKIKNKEVEPNSAIASAFKYLIKHWENLTKFCNTIGAPLDNNTAERLIKKAVLHRKNSLFYKTEDGAKVGDAIMSIIQTAISAEVDPFEYLITLQKNSKAIAKNPQLWLPWNYDKMIKSTS